jgi:hypothetical protein
MRLIKNLLGLSIGATDGDVGKVKDVYFDDRRWAVRYLVVDTGGWLGGRKVLISPIAVTAIDWDGKSVRVGLSRKQVEGSPDIDTDKPVSRQYEADYLRYYGYPDYWGGPLLWGATAYPFFDVGAPGPVAEGERRPAEPCDPHLRSVVEVSGYGIQASDASIGHLEDLLFEPESWAVRYLVVDTRNWWPGERVVIPPRWIEQLDWPEHRVKVGVRREEVRAAPKFDPASAPTREYEERLHSHYQREGYWGTPH